MQLKLCTWNINSVRLRAPIVERVLREEAPDVLCLQETKSPVEKLPTEVFAAAGYTTQIARGEKNYNGVMILARIPLESLGHREFCGKTDTRHVAAKTRNGTVIHNFYVPSGGDEPDPSTNAKFDHKLRFLAEMRDWWQAEKPARAILVGDLNIAPREDDVWSHKQLLKVVSHTPVEVAALTEMQEAGGFVDITRAHVPEGRLYSWWSYRSPNWDTSDKGRRLDHIWATPELAANASDSAVLRAARGWEKPSDHAPVFATFED
ncbi:MAG: exodeoxyribonuclease III [Pseudomonadota bacterium]